MTEREKKLIGVLREVEKTLRIDPFVMVNMANYISQELAEIEAQAEVGDGKSES